MRFFAFLPQEMKVSVGSHNIVCNFTNQCPFPDSVHDLYSSMEFLVAANYKCYLKAKLASSVRKHMKLLVNKRSLIFPVTTPIVDLGQNIRKNCSFFFRLLFV